MKTFSSLLLAWWFLFYSNPDSTVSRFGPMEQATCEHSAKELRKAGLVATCVDLDAR